MMLHAPVRTLANTTPPVLTVEGLHITRRGRDTALVEDVRLHLVAGETLALIGESGSSKTLTAMALAGILPAGLMAA